MISVILPTLNEEAIIETCLKSLINQSMPRGNYEIIVVDGGSKDKTIEIANQYCDTVIIQKRKGIGGARKDGAEIANGDILAFIDADGTYPKDWLQKIENNLKGNDACYGLLKNRSDNFRSAVWNISRKISPRISILIGFKYLPGPNAAVKKSVYFEVGGHDEISAMEDYGISKKLNDAKKKILFDKTLIVETASRRANGGLINYLIKYAKDRKHYDKKEFDKLLSYPRCD